MFLSKNSDLLMCIIMQFQDLQVCPARVSLGHSSIIIPTVNLGGFDIGP